MNDLWARLEAYATSHAKRSLGLRPGASEAAITAAERAMNVALPRDFRESLALHDGQTATDDTFEWLPGCSPLVSLDAMVARWKEERDLDESAEPDGKGLINEAILHHPKRIPIAGNQWWDGDNTYLDLIPGAEGTAGQVIMFTSECDMDAMGTSFREALERYVRALESGEWLFDAAKGFVRHRSEKADEFPNESYAFAQWVEKAAKPKPIAKAPKPKATPASAKPAATKSKANAKAKPKKTAKKATKKPKRK